MIEKPVLYYRNSFKSWQTIYLERKALAIILGVKKIDRYEGIPVTATAWITRWAITSSVYNNYDIRLRQDSLIANADNFTWLPVSRNTNILDIFYSFKLSEHDYNIKVFDLTLSAWPHCILDEKVKPFWKRRNELSVENKCIMLGFKVITPQSLQQGIRNLYY